MLAINCMCSQPLHGVINRVSLKGFVELSQCHEC